MVDKSAGSCDLVALALVERCLTNKANSADVSMNQMMFRNSFSSMPNMSRYLVTRLTSNDDLSDSSTRVHISEECRSQPIQLLCMSNAHSAESTNITQRINIIEDHSSDRIDQAKSVASSALSRVH